MTGRSETTVRVRNAETDQMCVVYHGNYHIIYFVLTLLGNDITLSRTPASENATIETIAGVPAGRASTSSG